MPDKRETEARELTAIISKTMTDGPADEWHGIVKVTETEGRCYRWSIVIEWLL